MNEFRNRQKITGFIPKTTTTTKINASFAENKDISQALSSMNP